MGFVAACPLAPWTLIAGSLGLIVGLFGGPYYPHSLWWGSDSDMCFLDAGQHGRQSYWAYGLFVAIMNLTPTFHYEDWDSVLLSCTFKP